MFECLEMKIFKQLNLDIKNWHSSCIKFDDIIKKSQAYYENKLLNYNKFLINSVNNYNCFSYIERIWEIIERSFIKTSKIRLELLDNKIAISQQINIWSKMDSDEVLNRLKQEPAALILWNCNDISTSCCKSGQLVLRHLYDFIKVY